MNVYGLIGNPLGHSFSKQYFTEKFEKAQLSDCRFELFPLGQIGDLKILLNREADLKGLAVTIPYKESVIPLLHHIEEKAAAIGAVNCIRLSAGTLTGYNTDSTGFELSLLPLLKDHHNKALILGSGGSSKAVQYVLRKLEIDFIVVTRSNLQRKGYLNYHSIDQKIISEYTMIINCTPVGMHPNVSELPDIPYLYLTEKHLLYDLIYKPAQTQFLAQGILKNTTVKNGYEMLILQAEENWKIWNETAI